MALKRKKPDDVKPIEGGVELISPPKRSKRWCKICGRKHPQRQNAPRECDLVEYEAEAKSGRKVKRLRPRV